MKRRMGDRYDGYRLRKIPAFSTVVPHIMPQRADAQVMGEFEIDSAPVEAFLKAERAKGERLSFMDVFIAALVRTIAKHPAANRFSIGRKLYARNRIWISFVAKKSMSVESEDNTLKIEFEPTDTVYEVSNRVRERVDFIKQADATNDTTDFANIISRLPVWLMALFIGLLKAMDKIGIMPRQIIDLSPFHTSIFITNFGSMGFEPIYHHIYNFGSTTAFLSFGPYAAKREIGKDGEVVVRRTVKIMYVADERVSDGYEMAVALKGFISYLRNPASLTEPPERVNSDRAL